MQVTGKIQRNNDRFFKLREREKKKRKEKIEKLYKNKVKRDPPPDVCVGEDMVS